LAEILRTERHVVLRAPTGAGKTLAVLAPFLLLREQIKVAGLIYVLPLRTLVEAVSAEAQELAKAHNLEVAVQTGERADAEFFYDADIIVTTFDQLLSGLLCEPYGLSNKLWNINAAAIAGKMIVFDEFHLMEPDRAFASALFGVCLFKDLCVTVWMTATATSALIDRIISTLQAKELTLSQKERHALFEGNGISRRVRTHWNETLSASHVLAHQGSKVLVVVNTVRKAQSLFGELEKTWKPLLLHSRFFPNDRREKQRLLKESKLTIATQVIEAGVDISSEILLTEAAPVNALVQRAGRCARFKGESGTIHIYGTDSPLPYQKAQIETAERFVEDTDYANPETCQKWVEAAHAEEDRKALTGFRDLLERRKSFIRNRVTGEEQLAGVASFIRPDEDTVRVFILAEPPTAKPQERQAIQLRRSTVRKYQAQSWAYEGGEWIRNGNTNTAHAIALPPSIARYTEVEGLTLGRAGEIESPPKLSKVPPGWGTLSAELWVAHTENVIRHALLRMNKEGISESFTKLVTWVAKLHDVGKLQAAWQSWAHERQAKLGKPQNAALAHTDYDSKLHRGEPRPPHHAAAGALYGACYLHNLPENDQTAVLLAVLAHHGGTIKGTEPTHKLHGNAMDALGELGLHLPQEISHIEFKKAQRDNIAMSFYDVWPLTAILSRILRLSDQKATAESGYEEP
jgi:CRISPR-associated endonuclease/helicase Cas3